MTCKGLRKVIADAAAFAAHRDKWCHHSRRDLRLIRAIYHRARVRPRAFTFAGANAAQGFTCERRLLERQASK